MGAEIEIVFEGMSHIMLDQCAWHRIAILVCSHTTGREEANVVALLCDNDSHLWLLCTSASSTVFDRVQVIPCCRGLSGPIHA